MREVSLVGVHCSGRFDCDPVDFVRYVIDCLNAVGNAEVVTTTEVQDRKKRRLLKKYLRVHGFRAASRGEHVIGLHKSRFGPIRSARLRWLTDVPDFPHWRQMKIANFRARDRKTNRPMILSVTHSPSGVQIGDQFRMTVKGTNKKNVAVTVVRKGYAEWGRRISIWIRLGRRYVVAVGDTNIDMKSIHWNRWASSHLGAECAVPEEYKGPGTLGPRFVDTAFFAGKDVRSSGTARALVGVDRPEDLDHTGSMWRALVGVQ